MKDEKQLIAMSMNKELVRQLKAEAKSMELSLSAYIRFILARRHNHK